VSRDEARTIKVRCVTWDQVEAFYTQKLKGDTLVVKMPIEPMIGDGVTVALGLPSGLVFAIDGSVTSVGGADTSGKWPVAMKMHGLTREVRERLERLVRDGREGLLSTPPMAVPEPPNGDPLAAGTGSAAAMRARPKSVPPPDGAEPVPPEPEPRLEDVALDERPAFVSLAAVHKRLLTLPAHEVLGVSFEADLRAIRAGYFALAQKHHPDAYGKYASPALRRLASELFIHVNRAYDRMREAAIRANGVTTPAPAARDTTRGWLVDADVALAEPRDTLPDANAPAPVAPVPIEIVGESPSDQMRAAAAAPAPAATTAPTAAPEVTRPDRPGNVGAARTAEGTPAPPAPPQDLASELFGDLPAAAAEQALPFDAHVPASTESVLSLANAGRAAMMNGSFEEARSSFAAALRLDGRNRTVRALYHVASGMLLRQRGQSAEAQTQFETALGHDPACADALRALGRTGGEPSSRFKRVFDR
jgi:tetratricopeptide (TPR) repeat protein